MQNIEYLVQELNIQNYSIIPYFSKLNLSFFEENVFIKEEDIENTKHDIKELFSKTIINRINFGKLTIMSNGSVYSNVNSEKLFDLGYKSIHAGIFFEIQHGVNWMKTRNNIEPCKNCLYTSLCPPISNYEYVLKSMQTSKSIFINSQEIFFFGENINYEKGFTNYHGRNN